MGTIANSVALVYLSGCEANGSDAEVEVTLEAFDRISEFVCKGRGRGTHFDVEGVMVSPELGIDDEIPHGAPVRVRVLVAIDGGLLYEFTPID